MTKLEKQVQKLLEDNSLVDVLDAIASLDDLGLEEWLWLRYYYDYGIRAQDMRYED